MVCTYSGRGLPEEVLDGRVGAKGLLHVAVEREEVPRAPGVDTRDAYAGNVEGAPLSVVGKVPVMQVRFPATHVKRDANRMQAPAMGRFDGNRGVGDVGRRYRVALKADIGGRHGGGIKADVGALWVPFVTQVAQATSRTPRPCSKRSPASKYDPFTSARTPSV